MYLILKIFHAGEIIVNLITFWPSYVIDNTFYLQNIDRFFIEAGCTIQYIQFI